MADATSRAPTGGEETGQRFDDATLSSMCGAALRVSDEVECNSGPIYQQAAQAIRRLVKHLRRERKYATMVEASEARRMEEIRARSAASPSGDAGRGETDPYFVLDFCEGAIRDAITLEDGLDGASGERVLAMIANAKAARRSSALPSGDGGKDETERDDETCTACRGTGVREYDNGEGPCECQPRPSSPSGDGDRREEPKDRAPVTHDVKCWPEPFAALRRGDKTFEWRKDDREPRYEVGDTLRAHEWVPFATTFNGEIRGEATGEIEERRITYALRGCFGVPKGYVVLALSRDGDRPREETTDAARYRFLRDNPLGLRAVDGSAKWPPAAPALFDSYVDGAMEYDELTSRSAAEAGSRWEDADICEACTQAIDAETEPTPMERQPTGRIPRNTSTPELAATWAAIGRLASSHATACPATRELDRCHECLSASPSGETEPRCDATPCGWDAHWRVCHRHDCRATASAETLTIRHLIRNDPSHHAAYTIGRQEAAREAEARESSLRAALGEADRKAEEARRTDEMLTQAARKTAQQLRNWSARNRHRWSADLLGSAASLLDLLSDRLSPDPAPTAEETR